MNRPSDPARRESRLRHPLRSVEEEVDHLQEIAEEGESAATPAILAATWVAIVVPLIVTILGLAFGIAYLVTGSAWRPTVVGPATTQTTPTPTTQTAGASGEPIFAQNCSPCHGATGHGGIGPNLTTLPAARNLSVVVHQVANGGGGMPPFKGTLDEQQIQEVAAYVSRVLAHGRS